MPDTTPSGRRAHAIHHRRVFGTLLALVLTVASTAATLAAALQVAASTGNLGALAQEIGGQDVEVTILAPPDTDLRSLDVQPAMVQALRRADLLIALGNDLEAGWLPEALTAAANPHDLSPGQPRRLDALAVPRRNPRLVGALANLQPAHLAHLDLDPVHLGEMSGILAQRLADLDPEQANNYALRANAFAKKLLARMPQWQRQAKGSAKLILYSAEPVILLERLGIAPLEIMEKGPGIALTGADLADLLSRMEGQTGVIVVPSYVDSKAPRLVAKRLDWSLITLPLDVSPGANGDDYLDHIGAWVDVATGVRTQ